MKERIEAMFDARLEQLEKQIEQSKPKGFLMKLAQAGKRSMTQIISEQCYEEVKAMKKLVLENM